MDVPTIRAALHDVVEDSTSSRRRYRAVLADVARLVEGATKIDQIPCHSRWRASTAKPKTLRKMFVAMAEDVRSYHQDRDRPPQHAHARILSPDRQQAIARETMTSTRPRGTSRHLQ